MNKNQKFLLFSFCFIFGLAIFPFLEVERWALFVLSGICLVFSFAFSSKQVKLIFISCFFCIVGMLRLDFSQKSDDYLFSLEKLYGQKIDTVGIVAEMPEVKNGKQRVIVEIKLEDSSKTRILSYVSQFQKISFGDRVNFKGILKKPENFDDFDYEKYLSMRDIYFVSYYPEIRIVESGADSFMARTNSFRLDASERFSKVLPEPHAGILSATIFGLNSAVSPGILEAFNRTGTRHIIAVSGSHMVILVAIMLFAFLSSGFHRKKVFYMTSSGILAFVLVSGLASSAIRAGIMAFTILFAEKIGRLNKSFSALIFAAVFMLIIDPHLLANDIGFQLSFLATFGIIILFPYFKKQFEKWPSFIGIKDMFLVTLSAQIVIMPILVANFDGFSVFSFLANIMILPITPALMAGGFVLFVLSYFSMSLAQVVAFPLYLILSYQLAVVDFFAKINFGYIKF